MTEPLVSLKRILALTKNNVGEAMIKYKRMRCEGR